MTPSASGPRAFSYSGSTTPIENASSFGLTPWRFSSRVRPTESGTYVVPTTTSGRVAFAASTIEEKSEASFGYFCS